MSFQSIDLGTQGTQSGDTIRNAFDKVNSNFIDTQSQINGKADAGHVHDSRYYTQSQIDAGFLPLSGGILSGPFKVNVSVGGDGGWDEGIIIDNIGADGEAALAWRQSEMGSNYWIGGVNQSPNWKLAYGTSFTDGQTKLELATDGSFLKLLGNPLATQLWVSQNYSPSHSHPYRSDSWIPTKVDIESVLTGSISSHSHTYLPLWGGTLTGLLNSIPGNSIGLFQHQGKNSSGQTTNIISFGGAQALGISGATDRYEHGFLINTGALPRNFFIKATSGKVNLVTDQLTLQDLNTDTSGGYYLVQAGTSKIYRRGQADVLADIGGAPAHTHPYRSDTWVPSWSDVTGKPSTFTPSAHTHPISEVTNLQTSLNGKLGSTAQAVDSAMLEGKTLAEVDTRYRSSTWVPGWTDITGKPSTFTPSAHSHTLSEISNSETGGEIIVADGTGGLIGSGKLADGLFMLDDPLSDISDVTISAIASGEILKWSGTAWINQTLSEAGIAPTSHTHSYLPLGGGTVSGATTFSNASFALSGIGLGSGDVLVRDGNYVKRRTAANILKDAKGVPSSDGSIKDLSFDANNGELIVTYSDGTNWSSGKIFTKV